MVQNNYEWWPPYGDVIAHSIFSAMQNSFGKITFEVPSGLPFYAPMSSYLFTPSLSLFLNLTIPETFLIISSVGISLILLCTASIVYYYSKSLILISIILFSFFIANEVNYGDRSLWNFFEQGVIPNLLVFSGILILPLLLIEKNTRHVVLTIFLISYSTIIIYPSSIFYIFLLLISFTILIIIDFFKIANKRKNNFKLTQFFPISLPLILTILCIFSFFEGTPIAMFENLLIRSEIPISDIDLDLYILNTDIHFFTSPFFLYSTFLGLFSSSFLLIFSKKERYLGLFWLFFYLIIFDSGLFHFTGIFEKFSFTYRFSILLPIFSMINCGIALYILTNKISSIERKFSNSKLNFLFFNLGKYFLISLFGFLILFLVMDTSHILLDNGIPVKFASNSQDYIPYIPGMKKITEIANSDDIIYTYIFQSDNQNIDDKFSEHRYFDWIAGIKFMKTITTSNLFFQALEPDEKQILFDITRSEIPILLEYSLYVNKIDYIITDNFPPKSDKLKEFEFLKLIYNDEYSNIYEVTPILPPLEIQTPYREYLNSFAKKYTDNSLYPFTVKDADYFLDHGDFKSALKTYDPLITEIRYPDQRNIEEFNHLLLNKGLTLEKLERFSDAKEVYQRILLFDKNNAIALERLSKLE